MAGRVKGRLSGQDDGDDQRRSGGHFCCRPGAVTMQGRPAPAPLTPGHADEPLRVAALLGLPAVRRVRHRQADACNLRLLGLRATIEVLKQPPVIAKQERAGEGD